MLRYGTLRLRQQHPHRSGEQAEHGRTVLRGDVPETRSAEAVDEYDGRSRYKRRHRRVVLRVAVKVWKHDQMSVFVAYASVLRHGLASVDVVSVSDQATLRATGRPGRVQNCDVVSRRFRKGWSFG